MKCPVCEDLMIKSGTSIRCLKCDYTTYNSDCFFVKKYGLESKAIVEDLSNYIYNLFKDASKNGINKKLRESSYFTLNFDIKKYINKKADELLEFFQDTIEEANKKKEFEEKYG